MNMVKIAAALLLSAALPANALAQSHTIAQLGSAPLVGQIDSTPQLQHDVARQRVLFQTAGTKLGLTPHEYAQFQSRIEGKRLTYVTIPRHLDAMSWSSGGTVYVLHDVVIPAQTKGWEIDIQEAHQTVALFIPAKCGNLSLLRRPLPVIAKAAPARVAPVAQNKPAVQVAPAATAMPVAVAMPAAPAPAAAPYETVASAPAAPAAGHHFRLWPLLLLPIAAIFLGNHGGNTPFAPVTVGGPVPGPNPVAGCPTPAPH